MREVLEKFDFHNTVAKLDDAGLLFLVMERFKTVDLHPDRISNHSMGTIFEELVRRFNEALNENPGEHFTPREVIRLMVLLLLALDVDIVRQSPSMPPICGHRCARRSWPPSRSATDRPKSAATSTAILNPIPSYVTPRMCRWART